MNAYEQLGAIRYQLELNGANEATIDLVDKYLTRAEPQRDSDTAISQVMMIRHLLRSREALDTHAIYDDLQELMSDFDARRVRDDDVRPAYEDDSRQPRPKSYYRALKEKERNNK